MTTQKLGTAILFVVYLLLTLGNISLLCLLLILGMKISDLAMVWLGVGTLFFAVLAGEQGRKLWDMSEERNNQPEENLNQASNNLNLYNQLSAGERKESKEENNQLQKAATDLPSVSEGNKSESNFFMSVAPSQQENQQPLLQNEGNAACGPI